MKRRDFFISAMQAEKYQKKPWIFAAFSVIDAVKESLTDEPWSIHYIKEGEQSSLNVHFIDGEGNLIDLEDYEFNPDNPQPPFQFQEQIQVSADELPNLNEDVTTTYGNVLANMLLLVYPFGNKLGFINQRFQVGDIEKIIEKRLVDTPAEGEQRDPQSIYIDEYNRFREAASLIDGLTQLCVPAASEKSLTTHPRMKELRDQLLERYKDQLDDPTILAEIERQLLELDAEHLEGDPSENFFVVSKKIRNVARKRTHVMIGQEGPGGKDGQSQMIDYSLSEGWDPEDMPALASDVREGSYDRSVMTAVGGEAAKFIIRTMQNNRIEADDCGSELGVEIRIDETNRDHMLYNWIFSGDGIIQLTDDNINQYMNRTVRMRTPLFCHTPDTGFCKTCIGGRYADHPTGIAVAASEIGNIIMDIFMQSAHATALEVVDYKFEESLS